jgi:hypothetical protein
MPESGEGISADVRPLAGREGKEKRAARNEPADRRNALKIILNLRRKGLSYQKIAQILELEGIATFSGRGKWHAQTVQKLYRQII